MVCDSGLTEYEHAVVVCEIRATKAFPLYGLTNHAAVVSGKATPSL
jgi:hypothetical protein